MSGKSKATVSKGTVTDKPSVKSTVSKGTVTVKPSAKSGATVGKTISNKNTNSQQQGANSRERGQKNESPSRNKVAPGCEWGCCEHGVPYDCCDPPIPEQKQEIVLNYTEACTCEDKWDKVERWKKETWKRDKEERRRERERVKREEEWEIERQKLNEKQHKEEMIMKKQQAKERQADEERWRRNLVKLEEKKMFKEQERWLEELCNKQEDRYYKERQKKRKDEQIFRKMQLEDKSTKDMAVPELEELRRMFAPVPQGQNEIFEYFTVEPRQSEEDKRLRYESQASALMGLTNKEGIHIKVGDRQPKKATLQLNMGPCIGPIGNGGPRQISISSGSEKKCCDPQFTGVVPPEIQSIMMKVKEMNNPLMTFQQSSPNWANMQGTLAFPPGVGNSLAPYYVGNGCCPPTNYPPC